MIPELTPADVKDRLDGDGAPLLLDVREPWELSLAALPQAINIPMAQLPDRLDELDRGREIVVMCHHGSRSLQVAVFLKHNGFDSVFNLAGGIDAWSADVDPGVPLY